MKVGEIIESSIWITGEEPPELRKKYEYDVRNAIAILCKGFIHGPVSFVEKRPEEDRVPEVPDHISGQRVRLLVGECELKDKLIEKIEGSFAANLERKDLVKLRKLTREKSGVNLTNERCDEIINQIGPEAVLETLH